MFAWNKRFLKTHNTVGAYYARIALFALDALFTLRSWREFDSIDRFLKSGVSSRPDCNFLGKCSYSSFRACFCKNVTRGKKQCKRGKPYVFLGR